METPATAPDAAMVLLSQTMDAGHDDATTSIMAGLLRMGLSPAVIAKETGKPEVVILSFIGVNPVLTQAYKQGRGAVTRRLAARIDKELDGVVATFADVMHNSDSDATRVSAAEALKRLAFETGTIVKVEGEGDQQGVSIGFEGSGRLAILLGGQKVSAE